MKKLNKTQLILFIASAVSLLLDFIVINSEMLGIGSKAIVIITLLKSLYDLYNSFNEDNMIEFAKEIKDEPDYKYKGEVILSIKEKLYIYKNKKNK